MEIIHKIFGSGDELNALQMSSRAVAAFLFTLLLVRVAGRRSFGLHAPIDNIVLILLGAILGRAVVGASPFFPTLTAGLVISICHRLFAFLCLRNILWDTLTKGEKLLLYENGIFNIHNMNRSLINEEDLMEEVRLRAHVDSLDQVQAIYMERNGKISTVNKIKK